MVSFNQQRPDFAPYGLTCVHWNPTPMLRPDHHSEVELNLLESGWLVYLLGGRKVKMEAGQLSVFWAAIPHQIVDFKPHTSYFVVTIPFVSFLKWKMPELFVQPILQGEIWRERKPSGEDSDKSLFSQWEEDLKCPSRQMADIVLLEIEARLRRMSAALPSEPNESANLRRPRRSLEMG